MGKRRSFDKEFKLGAVKLVKNAGISVRKASRDLGIHETSLRHWIKQHEIDHGQGPEEALKTDEREELGKLRRDVRRLRMEREVLKKAATFFAKESE